MQEYGPAFGMESIAERKAREAKMREDYEKKMRDIEDKKGLKVSRINAKINIISF